MTYFKFGVHGAGVGGIYTGLGEYIAGCNAARVPCIVQAVDNAGPAYAVQQLGRDYDVISFRFTVDGSDGFGMDQTKFHVDPVAYADYRMNDIARFWPRELDRARVWTCSLNEPSKDSWQEMEWVAAHQLRCGQIAVFAGERFSAYGWSMGTPEAGFWELPDSLAYLRLCSQHPDLLAVNLHEYSGDDDITDNQPYFIGRFQFLHDVCDDYNIPHPTIIMGEFGWREASLRPSPGTFESQLAWAQSLYAPHDNILGAAIWTLGNWHGTVAADLAGKMPILTNIATSYPPYTEPDPPPPPPATKHKAIVVKLPQSMTEAEWLDACRVSYPLRHTVTASHDDMMTTLHGGNADSYVKFSHPARDVDAVALVEAAGYSWQPLYTAPPPSTFKRLAVPHLSQYGSGADARSNDCGAACVAMVARLAGRTPTVDQVALAYQSPANSYMSFTQIDAALNGYGMDGTYARPFLPQDADNAIEYDFPAICLVWYQSMPQKFSAFNGAHFIAIYGTDGTDKLLYRDPLAPDGRELVITFAQLDAAMKAVTLGGQYASQGMVCAVRIAPPPPIGVTVDIRPYFEPAGAVGQFTVFSWLDGSKTQDQQLRRLGDGTIALVKGGDYERWRFANSEMQRAEDTSMGGGLAYTQNWARWLPQVVTVGATYTNSPRIIVKRRADCATTADAVTTDYLTIHALHKSWRSPYGLDFAEVLEIHWRKTPSGTIQEKYFVAPGLAYVAWGPGEIEAAVSELPLGRPSLPWASWGCG